ncbi:TPA: hypothetical protein EYO12_03930 [Candidatus Saccharibacteria bacterium]|nr:hypothetical protein [Candidatus Saccharibacteria bacterium]HIO87816.1 hypothetical protein [Candidatus Saccharibacteria bacterium]
MHQAIILFAGFFVIIALIAAPKLKLGTAFLLMASINLWLSDVAGNSGLGGSPKSFGSFAMVIAWLVVFSGGFLAVLAFIDRENNQYKVFMAPLLILTVVSAIFSVI